MTSAKTYVKYPERSYEENSFGEVVKMSASGFVIKESCEPSTNDSLLINKLIYRNTPFVISISPYDFSFESWNHKDREIVS